MVELKVIEDQLKKIGFKTYGWGRTEVRELPNIILPDEEIFECVNGIYEGGFALFVATDTRVLLVDKKPLNYLTVEDLRYELISEIDYNHRLIGAYISISSGTKNLKFRSYNQPRLRKLISHVQHCMAESKKKESSHQEGQKQHLEEINQQLQTYLIAQHEQQQKLQEQLEKVHAHQRGETAQAAAPMPAIEPLRPSPQLADYLYAQSLLAQHQLQTGQAPAPAAPPAQPAFAAPPAPVTSLPGLPSTTTPSDLYAAGMREIYGKRDQRLRLGEFVTAKR